MTNQTPPESFHSLAEAAQYAKVTRQAIYLGIKSKKIKAEKVDKKWFILKKDLDAFRASKYNGDKRKINGQLVYSLEQGHYSVQQARTLISQEVKIPYSFQHIYYLLRTGALKGYRKGRSWIIYKEDLKKLIQDEMDKKDQMLIM